MPEGSGPAAQQPAQWRRHHLDRAQRAVLDNLLKARAATADPAQRCLRHPHSGADPPRLLYSRQNSKIDGSVNSAPAICSGCRTCAPEPGGAARRPGRPRPLPSTRPTGCNCPGPSPRTTPEPDPGWPRAAGTGLVLAETGPPPHSIQPVHCPAHRQGNPGQVQPHQPVAGALVLAALPLPAMVLMVHGLLDGAWQYPFAVAVAGAWVKSGSCCWPCWWRATSPWRRGSSSSTSAGRRSGCSEYGDSFVPCCWC